MCLSDLSTGLLVWERTQCCCFDPQVRSCDLSSCGKDRVQTQLRLCPAALVKLVRFGASVTCGHTVDTVAPCKSVVSYCTTCRMLHQKQPSSVLVLAMLC